MSCFLDGFYESRLMSCRKPLEDPKPAIEPPKIAGFKGEVKEKKIDPTERLKKALPKSIKQQTKKDPTIRLKNSVVPEEKEIPASKLDGVIKNLIHDAEDKTIDKLFHIITEKLDNENVIIKDIRNKRKFILNLL